MAGGKVYSFEEVAKHSDRKDCWLVIAGKDATADFEDIGHSDDAKEMMPQYLIGEIDAASIPAKHTYAYSNDASSTKASKGAGAWATLMQVAVPVLLLGLALAMRSYGKAAE
ncbi:unnamed protein product [Urochloa humidicola]